MNALEQLLLGWTCAWSSVRIALRPSLWPAWIVLGGAQLALLAALACCVHPLVSALAAPLVASLAGPAALHYPTLFHELPRLFARVDAPIVAWLGAWAAGVTSLQVVAMADRASSDAREALRSAWRRLPALLVAQLPLFAMEWLLGDGITLWLHHRGSGGLVVKAVTLLAGVTLGLGGVFLCWLPVLVIVGRYRVLEAWHELPRLGGRGFGAALVVLAMAWIPQAPFALALRGPGRWIDMGHPEWVALLMVGQLVVALVMGLLATIAIALAWTALREEP
ncbi:MAG: hypothetical protein ACHQ52_00455 [Candidatus Eisenbacteria bacterium]